MFTFIKCFIKVTTLLLQQPVLSISQDTVLPIKQIRLIVFMHIQQVLKGDSFHDSLVSDV